MYERPVCCCGVLGSPAVPGSSKKVGLGPTWPCLRLAVLLPVRLRPLTHGGSTPLPSPDANELVSTVTKGVSFFALLLSSELTSWAGWAVGAREAGFGFALSGRALQGRDLAAENDDDLRPRSVIRDRVECCRSRGDSGKGGGDAGGVHGMGLPSSLHGTC